MPAIPTPNGVPPHLQDLIPLAEQWGISDNDERDDLLESASDETLNEFVADLESRCDEIIAWIATLPPDFAQWPEGAAAFVWLQKTWHEAACELEARARQDEA